MPTNEERREVAEKIRKMIEDRYNFTALNVADVIGVEEVVFDDRYAFDEACWLRLADLIEPEPEETAKKIKHGEPNGSQQCYSCSKCSYGWHEDIYDKPFSYCPNCRAKLVD